MGRVLLPSVFLQGGCRDVSRADPFYPLAPQLESLLGVGFLLLSPADLMGQCQALPAPGRAQGTWQVQFRTLGWAEGTCHPATNSTHLDNSAGAPRGRS